MLCTVSLLAGPAAAAAPQRAHAAGLASGDTDFLAVHDAYVAGDRARLKRYAGRLNDSPLQVYASYYQLSLALKDHAAAPVPDSLETSLQAFFSRPGDTPVIDRLRVQWLKRLGANRQWDLFDAGYPHVLKDDQDTELSCYALQSRRRSQEQAALHAARRLWFTGSEQPASCGVLFDAAMSAGIISARDVGQRLRLALEANNVGFAAQLGSRLSGRLGGEYAALPALLRSAAADPQRYLKKLTPRDAPGKGAPGESPAAQRDTEIAAALAGDGQRTASGPLLEVAASAPVAASPAIPGVWPDWGRMWARLGLGEIHGPELPAATALADRRHGGTYDPACDPPCQAIGDSTAAPPWGWYPKLATRSQRLVALYALERLAKQSPELAYQQWERLIGYFPRNEQHYFYGRLAYQAARNLDPRALQWYREAGDTPLDESQSAWRVRSALRAQDWNEVLASIAAMGEQQQRDMAWQYWKARALLALGRPAEARAILAPISGDFSFYGQLAGAELADTPVLSSAPPAYKPGQQAIAAMLVLPGIQRTLILYRIGMRNEALDEWRWTLRDFDDRQLLTAAEIARRNEMYDRAIGAADKTISLHDFSLRYLAPYRADLQTHIREHGLDEAWVYGLMRQESRFATGAKSDAGAAGLMQIMPGTARWAAHKLGLKSYRRTLIHQLDTNLRLGTYYMKAILTQSGNNPALASAAYNAGPLRALQWRGEQPMEGAIYIETIPYEETRDYVKKVMSNTTYYARQFGDPPRSLKQRLGTVPGRADRQSADPHVP